MMQRTLRILPAVIISVLVATPPALAQVAGGFGLGTTTPMAALHVLRDDGAAQVLVQETSATSSPRTLFKISNNGPTRFQIENTVGGGALRFNFALNNGGDFVIDEPGDAQNPEFLFTKHGNLTIAGTLTQNSDARLKREVAPLTGVIDRLSGVRAVSFRFKDGLGPTGSQVGLLAQEVRRAFPELVHEDGEGHLSVAYGNLTAVLLQAINEQQAVIDELSAKVQRLASARDGN